MAGRLAHAPIRILQVVEGLAADAGGPSRCVPQQCLAIATPDFQVQLVYPRTAEALAPEVEELRGKGIGLSGFSRSELIQELPILIQRHDVVHYNGLWSPLFPWVARVARRCGRPLVITPHGMLEPWALAQKAWKKQLALRLAYRKALDSAAVVHATALSEAEHLRALGLSQPMAIIANVVSAPEYESSAVSDTVPRRILFLSRIHQKKGLLELVRAAKQHQTTFELKGWRLTIAGSDADGHWAAVEREATKLSVRHLIDYVGYVDGQAKWDLYRSAALFILPTYSENFGLVIAEALASGVPCITTHGAPWQELTTRGCGWWHEVDQAALERALGEALSTPFDILKDMGQRGIVLVRDRYRREALGANFHDLYYWLLHRTDEPPFFLRPPSASA